MQFHESELGGAVDGDEEIQPSGQALNFFFVGLSPSTSGNRLMSWRSKQRCSPEDQKMIRGIIFLRDDRVTLSAIAGNHLPANGRIASVVVANRRDFHPLDENLARLIP